jgi:hypothetical protein
MFYSTLELSARSFVCFFNLVYGLGNQNGNVTHLQFIHMWFDFQILEVILLH